FISSYSVRYGAVRGTPDLVTVAGRLLFALRALSPLQGRDTQAWRLCRLAGVERGPSWSRHPSVPTLTSAGERAILLLAQQFLLELLGHLFDVLGRPAGDVHAQAQAHAREHFLDLVERLAAEVRRAQHLGFGLLDQIADVDDVVVLEAVGRTDR